MTSTRQMTLFGQIGVTQVLPPVHTNRCVVICLRVNTTQRLHKCQMTSTPVHYNGVVQVNSQIIWSH